jgi:hypothetical protein
MAPAKVISQAAASQKGKSRAEKHDIAEGEVGRG